MEVPVSELQKCSLFVATPMYGGQCFGSYTKSLLDLSRVCQSYGVPVQFSFIFNESLITRARNYLADEFMRSSHTHMMFIDSDIDFNPMDVLALLALKKPVIGGPYPKKCIAWENLFDAVKYGFVPNDNRGQLSEFAGDFVFNVVPGTTEIKLNEPTEVLEIGTGFMLIERSVFTKFAEAYPQYWYVPDHNRSASFDGSRKIYQYFQAEIENDRGRYLSEDYWFCQKARSAGMSVWLAPWMQLKHHGTYIYSGSIPAMAAVLNERITRNDPVPSVVRMDHSSTKPATPTAPANPMPVGLTAKQFYEYSATKRKSIMEQLIPKVAEQVGVNVDELSNVCKNQIKSWVQTTPTELFEELVVSLANTLKPTPVNSPTVE